MKPQAQLVSRVDENLARIYTHWIDTGFVALTAWRGNRTQTANARALRQLKRDVRAAGFGFIPVLGRYKEEGMSQAEWEPSVIIPASRNGEPALMKARKLAIRLGQKYDQDSVLFAFPGEEPRAELIQTRRDGPTGERVDDNSVLMRFQRFRVGQHFVFQTRTGTLGKSGHRQVVRGGAPFDMGGQAFTFEHQLSERIERVDFNEYARKVADAYDARPVRDPAARASYAALLRHSERMYKQLLSRIDIVFVDEGEPYADAADMTRRVEDEGVMYVSKLFSDNLANGWTPAQNWRFRAVHDYIVHIGGKHDFSLRGEIGTFNRHAKVAPKAALPALFSEIVGQVAYAIVRGDFPDPQKACILYGFDYERVGYINPKEYRLNWTMNTGHAGRQALAASVERD